MGFVNQNQMKSSSSCKGNGNKKKIYKNRLKGIEKKLHEFKTLCGVRALFYVKSEFNKDKNGDGLVRILPENPNECQEIMKDFINYNSGKRKRDNDEEVVDSECMNDNKMGKLCTGDVKEENQQVKFIDQNQLSNLSIEEIQEIEKNLEPVFGTISERIDQLMEKNRFNDPSAKGCNEDDVIMMKESPSLQLEPKFDYQSSSSTDFYNYGSASEKEFDYDINQWLNLPGLTNTTTTDDGIVFEPFPDLIDFEFEALNNYAGAQLLRRVHLEG
ncbi:hypothetical protein C5167_034578 [Papaver somniferum]|uniref:Uncharacterized protein n=1 Tax=Papaver somniferum TaxID=3469 RepID=A0A4Y7KG85_PAPSO|nr:uncharacterized protein LOC113299545 [Papaver somniferum]RZC71392.1 hypothetical protein C5167_034578 [Papaver somniferum]